MPKFSLPLLLLGSLFLRQAQAQNTPLSPTLESYIRIGLDSNLALHQRNFDLQRSLLDLKRAKAQFFPQANFNAQYTLADGGRTQPIPIGDLLNNVYSTLNQLTGSNKFPQVANQNIQFLPNDFQDTKVEVSLPILNPDLQHNRDVNGQVINYRKADVDIYRRDLVRSIRQAYYQYVQTAQTVGIYSNAELLVKANRRVSEKFVENNMATRESVFRAQAQVSQVESSLIQANNDRSNAAEYLNFLLNRSLDYPVLIDSALLTADPTLFPQDPTLLPDSSGLRALGHPATLTGVANREEFDRLRSTQHILQSNLRWNKNYVIPRLNAFYDVGFQGFGYHFSNSQFYQLAGISLTWNLFKAGDNKYTISQTIIDIRSTNEQYRQLTDQLNLEGQTAENNYASALQALQSLGDEVRAARETYRLTEKRYNEGQALQIELIDSRTQMTNAEIRYSLGQLAVLNRAADLERVTASYKF